MKARRFFLLTVMQLVFVFGFSQKTVIVDSSQAYFRTVIAVAKEVRGVLRKEKLEAFVKTSGKRGLHVLVPWTGKGDDEAAPHARRSRSSIRPASRQTLTSIHSAIRIAGATSSA